MSCTSMKAASTFCHRDASSMQAKLDAVQGISTIQVCTLEAPQYSLPAISNNGTSKFEPVQSPIRLKQTVHSCFLGFLISQINGCCRCTCCTVLLQCHKELARR
mmetsp:Transcript_56483/g.101243  ORF Transcript_56483/g.101243 Transcript_56483/m.101243 type:complete len:104 (-) Transcript_56483:90-401(-)